MVVEFDRPIFRAIDAEQAEKDLQAKYTEITGKQLFPAQPETLLANWAAYLQTVIDTGIQYTGEQSLVNYAVTDSLDNHGTFWDSPRLDAEPALTTLEFTLTGVQASNYLIPQGTWVRTLDRQFIFETLENLTIPQGDITGQVAAACTTPGIGGNGYAVGQISELFQVIPEVAGVTNTSTSVSGAEIETDDSYRQRLKLAPNRISSAGSANAYKYLAMSADSSIVDVGVESPDSEARLAYEEQLSLDLASTLLDYLKNEYNLNVSGIPIEDIAPLFRKYIAAPRFSVDVYVLDKTGNVPQEVLDKVLLALDGNSVRPVTDTVRVFGALKVAKQVYIEVIALANADVNSLKTRLNTIMDNYVESQASKLGLDIVPSQIIKLLQIDEVYEVKVTQPTETVKVNFNQQAIVTYTLNITGVSEP